MNERIRELVNTAISDVDYIRDDDFTNEELSKMYIPDCFSEKFAELIVQECCSKLEEMGESWHEFAKNPPQGQAHNASGALFAAYRLKEDAVDEIKQHFGVEE